MRTATTKLTNVTTRQRLPKRKKPFYISVADRLCLGYAARWPKSGVWYGREKRPNSRGSYTDTIWRIGDADDREARPVVRHLVGHHRQQALGRVPGLFPLLVIRLRVKAKVHPELAVEPGFAEGGPRPRTAVENEVLCVDDELKHPGLSDRRSDELPRTKAPVPTE